MITGLHEHVMFFLGSTFQSGFPFPLLVGAWCHYVPLQTCFQAVFCKELWSRSLYFVARGFLQSDHGQAAAGV